MHISFDTDTVPMNTILTSGPIIRGPAPVSLSRGTVDAIVDPQTFNPRPLINGVLGWPISDSRYLILEDINPQASTPNYQGPEAWRNFNNTDFVGYANDVIQWNGVEWKVLFNSRTTTNLTYITNARTGVQYAWNGESWMKSYEGIYTAGKWRLVL